MQPLPDMSEPTGGQPDTAALLAESRAPIVERLRSEIEAAGRITFARFMSVALHDPVDGYYATRADRTMRTGDFLTAPETHPLFGATVARQLVEMWQRLGSPGRFVVREYGAGRGTLGLTILEQLHGDAAPLADALRYQPVETSSAAAEMLRERFERADLAGQLEVAGGAPVVGCIVANEFLDALPVHRVAWVDGGLQEIHVTWRDGWFADELGDPSTPDLAAYLHRSGVQLRDGQRAEINLVAPQWVERFAAALDRGFVLIVDYGHDAQELYGHRRMHGTLVAYRGHTAHDDPYRAVGEQDLTAHVDLTAIERAADAAGLQVLGRTTQAEFLAGSGLDELFREVQTDPATTAEDYMAARSAVVRFLDPAQTGRFAVLILGRGVDPAPPLRGLTFRLERPGRPAAAG